MSFSCQLWGIFIVCTYEVSISTNCIAVLLVNCTLHWWIQNVIITKYIVAQHTQTKLLPKRCDEEITKKKNASSAEWAKMNEFSINQKKRAHFSFHDNSYWHFGLLTNIKISQQESESVYAELHDVTTDCKRMRQKCIENNNNDNSSAFCHSKFEIWNEK